MFSTVCLVALGLVAIICLYVKRQFSFWKNRGVPFKKPGFPFGNLKYIGREDNLSVQFAHIYNEYQSENPPFVGLYFFVWPVVLATSLNFIGNVLVTDFHHFQERGRYYNEKDDPISANLFNLVHDKWKIVRSKMTSMFTSGKLKLMHPIMMKVVNESVTEMNNMLLANDKIDIFNFATRIQIDIIGGCIFGVEFNGLKNPDSEFIKYSEQVVNPKLPEEISSALTMHFKNLAKRFHIRSIRKDVSDFFTDLVRSTVAFREENNVLRDDLMGQMIKLKNEGFKAEKSNETIQYMSIEEIVAQAFAMHMGGTKTAAGTITFTLFELAQQNNRHIQDKARSEINTVLQKYNGDLTFEAMHEMPYVEAIINEILRKYPPIPFVPRLTTKEYTCAETKVTIPKNMTIVIPIYAIHHDPHIYENPDEFRPERFMSDELKQRPSVAFMPFGAGPRNCIASRLGMVQVRCSLIMLLKEFTFSTCDETIPMPIKFHPWKIVLASERQIILKVRKI